MTQVKITQLSFYPGNARRGDIDMIADSLKANGQYKPVVVNRGTHASELVNTILTGNHTVMAAQRIGWKEVDVHWVDVDEATARRIVLIDNKANDEATYDLQELIDLVGDGPLAGTGFTQDELDAMLEKIEAQSTELEDDAGDSGEGNDMDFPLTVQCESHGQREKLRTQLVREGFTVA